MKMKHFEKHLYLTTQDHKNGCHYCGGRNRKMRWDEDHLVWSCKSCNNDRAWDNMKTLAEFKKDTIQYIYTDIAECGGDKQTESIGANYD